MPQSKHIHIRYDDVAVPEIILDEDEEDFEDSEDGTSEDEIAFDDVAIPEIHPSKHHHGGELL